MEETRKKKKDDSKKKERHIVTWSQQVSIYFIWLIALYDRTEFLRCVFVRRRMTYFESKSLYMALTSSCLYSSSISLVVYWIDSDEKMCVCVCFCWVD